MANISRARSLSLSLLVLTILVACTGLDPANSSVVQTEVSTPSAIENRDNEPNPKEADIESSPSSSVSEPEPAPMPLVPDFDITVYQDGGKISQGRTKFSDVLDLGLPILLNFWAADLPPSRMQMPQIQIIHYKYSDQLLILGLDVGKFSGFGSEESGRELLRELNITYAAGAPSEDSLLNELGIGALPTTLLINTDGMIVERVAGAARQDDLEKAIIENFNLHFSDLPDELTVQIGPYLQVLFRQAVVLPIYGDVTGQYILDQLDKEAISPKVSVDHPRLWS